MRLDLAIRAYPPRLRQSLWFGYAMEVVMGTTRNRFRLVSANIVLAPAATLEQIAFSVNARLDPTGYVAWAFVTPEVLTSLRADPGRHLDLPEWNEGVELVIMDLVSLSGDVRGLLAQLRERCPEHDHVWWRRQDRSRAPLRRATIRRPERRPC
jgi:hemolysin-activating ACP:hemolysin acyltransferase